MSGSDATSVDLTVQLVATTPDGTVSFNLAFPIGVDETPNTGLPADCKYQPAVTPCPDALLLPGGTASQTIPLNSTHQYTLSVLGFASSPTSTTPESIMVAQEGQQNLGYLIASISRNNTPPVAADDSASTTSGGSTTIPALANDTDADNDPLSVIDLGTPTYGTATLNGDGTVTYTAPASFAGDDTFTYEASDGFSSSNAATVTVHVTDTTPPSFSTPSGTGPVEATGPGGAVVSYSATATDLVDGSVAVTCTPPSGSTFALGTTHVTCDATDAAGNTAHEEFDVTVVDTTPPTLSGVPSNSTAEATTPSGAVVTYPLPTATDTVDPNPTVDCEPPSGSTLGLGPHTITCTATDASGNTSAPQTFTVTVQDTTPPVLTVPAPITVNSPTTAGVAVTYSATATDAVDPSPTVACTPPSGSTFAPGTTTVTCTATDASGNSASKSFTVTVAANHAPICTNVRAVPDVLWPPNGMLRLVALVGASDPDHDRITYTITAVTQDEPLGKADHDWWDDDDGGHHFFWNKKGKVVPDAFLLKGGFVLLRAERDDHGNGRVYTIQYTVTDSHGATCSGVAKVGVPKDPWQRAVESPASYDSLG